ncbi:MAG: hypothetical protein JRI23_06480, partial [Deltaproteobacteria bacterium]|nr:hypothetical protein [Deltaproteobacteria bacterium]MBW2531228.1 hypothetical protein [Deltaproteobacteria bacterium]
RAARLPNAEPQQSATNPPDETAAAPAAPAVVPVPSPARDVQRDRLKAEVAFREGARRLDRGDARQALSKLELAHSLDPEAVEYELRLRWAQMTLAEEAAARDELREELQTLTAKALGEDRRSAFAYYVRGQLAMVAEDYETAFKHLARSVSIDPKHPDAARCYRIVKRRVER